MIDRTELQRIMDAATPRPWEWTTDLDALLGGEEGEYRVIDTAMPPPSYYALRVAAADAQLIAAAVNELPALLDADELRTWQERVALAAGLADEVQGYGVHLEADPDTAAEHVAGLLASANTHVECPTYCGGCCEPLADTPCDHCYGSGCGPGTASGAYEECEWCAGAGKVHVGCAEMSYAELCAERDELAAKLAHMTEARDNARAEVERLTAILDGRCLANTTHRYVEHRQSVCMVPEGHAPLVHDDCMGYTWADADHWKQSAVDRVADEVQRIADESQREEWDDPLVRILVGRISAALDGGEQS